MARAGTLVGAVGFGLLLGHTGYPMGFAITAALVFAALAPAVRALVSTAQRTTVLRPCPAAGC